MSSRADAKAAGLQVYFTGKACINGHIAERNTSTGNCKTCLSAYLKKYFLDEEKRLKKSKAHSESRRLNAAIRKRDVDGYVKRYRENPLFAMQSRMRSRINASFRKIKDGKPSSTEKLLGADWLTVKNHIESQFTTGMSWENRSQWHIDHIIPLKKATNQDDLVRLCHYTNLQPLWAEDNLRKGGK